MSTLVCLSHIESHQVVGAVVAAVVAGSISAIQKRAIRNQALDSRRRQTIGYPKIMKAMTLVVWLVPVASLMAVLVAPMSAEDAEVIALGASLLGLIILPVHLEVFCSGMSWDDEHIYARSPWRGRRTIPLSSITSCDYSVRMHWYRIHTDGHGVVRMNSIMSGVAELLRVLPCPTPSFPPANWWVWR